MNVLFVLLALWLLPTVIILLTALIAVLCAMVARMATQLLPRRGNTTARSSRL